MAVAAAILVYRDKSEPKRAWRILLDSESDGDLIFMKTADVRSINLVKRTQPLVWGISHGDFRTTKVGNVELKFTGFLQNKIFGVKPDIVMLEKNAPNPAF